MPDTRPALRAAAMAEAFGALAGLRGAAEVADLLRRIERFDEITARKALNDLRKAGLANHDEEDRWTATAAAAAAGLDLDAALAGRVLKAADGLQSGLLDPDRLYAAILGAARAGRFVSYGELARAGGAPWRKARRPLSVALGRLTLLAHVRGWPMLSAIVVGREGLETGALSESGLRGFVAAARSSGLDPGDDPVRFARACQAKVFEWAASAPDSLGLDDAFPAPGVRASGIAETEPPPSPSPYTVRDIVADGCFLPLEALEAVLSRLRARKNLILQGPPGTGKTWLARRLARVLLAEGQADADRLRVVQFHPSLAYEDFVRGWRPVDGRLELADGVLMQAIMVARSDEARPFVVVIEEINRGNPAQVLGEMLTLLEDTKRRPEEALELAYPREGERIYAPANLFVIGTMNVADRSLALVDLALRRRFAFVSLEPRLGPAWRTWAREVGGLRPDQAARIEARLDALNRMIASDPTLGDHFRIGHSYVTPTGPVGADGGEAWFRAVVETEILPLVDEYWHDQPDRRAEARAILAADGS